MKLICNGRNGLGVRHAAKRAGIRAINSSMGAWV